MVFSILKRVTGVDLLQDLSVFFRALGGMIDGFADRARRRRGAPVGPGDDVPDHHLARSTSRSRRRSTSTASCPTRGCRSAACSSTASTRRRAVDGELPEALAEELGDKLAARVGTSAREVAALAERDERCIEHLTEELGAPPTIVVPQLDDDVHDVGGLARVNAYLYGAAAKPR